MPLSQELINAAVRGFAENQQSYRAELPGSPHSTTARLLLDAARISLQDTAGYSPNRSEGRLPMPIESSEFPSCGFQAQQHLKLMLKGEYKALLQQWLE